MGCPEGKGRAGESGFLRAGGLALLGRDSLRLVAADPRHVPKVVRMT